MKRTRMRSQRYCRRQVPDELLLRERLRLLARRQPCYGYRRMHALLRREGWACNRKRIQRLWRDEGLRLPPKPRRRRRGRRMPGHVTAANSDQVWALDFLVDRTADGRPIKILTVTDEHTREALATPAARRKSSACRSRNVRTCMFWVARYRNTIVPSPGQSRWGSLSGK